MFNKKLKLEVKALTEELKSTEAKFTTLKKTVDELMGELVVLKADYHNYLEWCKMRNANEKAAATLGHFYITADDSALLERLIQECNKDKDLAVLLTTAQGTTLTLRSHPQPQVRDSLVNYKKYAEEEE